ncbi:MAG: hypothetical protein FWH05_08820 [Oscillospiraceae bacterium]|nr:hypothetical protein [Oscillospiraceae bacterium]
MRKITVFAIITVLFLSICACGQFDDSFSSEESHDSKVSTATANATTIRNIANGAMAKATAHGRDRKQIDTVQVIGVEIVNNTPTIYVVRGSGATLITSATTDSNWNSNGIVEFSEEVKGQIISSGISNGSAVFGIWGNRVMGSAFTQSVDSPGIVVGHLGGLMEQTAQNLSTMTPLPSGAFPGAFIHNNNIDERNVVVTGPLQGLVIGFA